MTRRVLHLALAAAAAAVASGARAQFRTTPIVVPAPGLLTDVLTAPFDGGVDAALLLSRPASGESALRAHHDLATPLPSPYAQPATYLCARAGTLRAASSLPDVAWGRDGEIDVAFGPAPGILVLYPQPPPTLSTATPSRPNVVRLLPRDSSVLVVPFDTGDVNHQSSGQVRALDLEPGAATPERAWDARPLASGVSTLSGTLPDEVHAMRLSATARALGIDDLYLPGIDSLILLAHTAAPTPPGTSLADAQVASFKIGGAIMEPNPAPLPAGAHSGAVLGAGPLDVDLDGRLDLVFTLSDAFVYAEPRNGQILWIRGTDDVADFATATVWQDLTTHPDLQPIVDPAFARSLELGGGPAFAVWDRGLDQILVITSDPVERRLRVWRGDAAGVAVRDIRLADVVGSDAPDLIADGTWEIDPFHPYAAPAVLVYPDDRSLSLAWAQGSPGTPLRGEDHRVEVVASGVASTPPFDWRIGDPSSSPDPLQHGSAYVIPGASLCGAPSQVFPVTVSATERGVHDELSATLSVALGPPSLEIAGAVPPGRLALPPGGTELVVAGSAWEACGDPVSFRWGGTPWPAGSAVTPGGGPTTATVAVALPEDTYPALLAGEPFVTLTAIDPATSLESPPATLPLSLDAMGLASVEHEADLPAMAPGEVAVLRTRVRSAIGVALPGVRVVDLLVGLTPVSAPRVTGAAVVETRRGGAEVVLDALPPDGEAVVVELAVRASGDRRASAVEARSSGGHLLTPPAAVPGASAPLPGCGCGSSAPEGAALAVLALAVTRARPRARRVT